MQLSIGCTPDFPRQAYILIIISSGGLLRHVLASLHGLLASSCHFFGIGLFAMFADIADAGRAVAAEDEGKDLADEIVIMMTCPYVLVAFGTSAEALLHAALPYFTPRSLFVLVTPRTLVRAIFPARSAVESAGSNGLLVCLNCFHHYMGFFHLFVSLEWPQPADNAFRLAKVRHFFILCSTYIIMCTNKFGISLT